MKTNRLCLAAVAALSAVALARPALADNPGDGPGGTVSTGTGPGGGVTAGTGPGGMAAGSGPGHGAPMPGGGVGGFGGNFGMGGGMPGGGGMMMGGGTAITVSGDFVYVVQGNTLFQFAVGDLHLVHQTTIPTPTMTTGVHRMG